MKKRKMILIESLYVLLYFTLPILKWIGVVNMSTLVSFSPMLIAAVVYAVLLFRHLRRRKK